MCVCVCVCVCVRACVRACVRVCVYIQFLYVVTLSCMHSGSTRVAKCILVMQKDAFKRNYHKSYIIVYIILVTVYIRSLSSSSHRQTKY